MSARDVQLNPPPREECLICYLTLPLNGQEVKYQECCGKAGASWHVSIMPRSELCRAPKPNSERGIIERTIKRRAHRRIFHLKGIMVKYETAVELWRRSAAPVSTSDKSKSAIRNANHHNHSAMLWRPHKTEGRGK